MILIDLHEPKQIIELLQDQRVVRITHLDVGDYIVGEVGIERKTITDFLCSLSSGRLYDQIQRLCQAYPQRYLLIEGLIDWSTLTNPGWFCHALQRLVLMGVPVIFSQSLSDSARLIERIAHTQRGLISFPKIVQSKCTIQDKQVRVLCAFPGIGEKRSRLLLTVFGTSQKVFTAKIKKLRKAGLGPKTAKSIRQVLEMDFKNNESYIYL